MTAPVLVIDTATTRATVALGMPADGEPGGSQGRPLVLAADAWEAGYRHGEELLARIETLLAGAGTRRADLGGIVVGTGPGAFTGLRVGMSTAKALAYALELPVVGVATSAALLEASGGDVLLLPAGPADRVCCRAGEPARILPGGTDPELRPDERLVAVDLAGRAPDAAVALGESARAALGPALLRLGLVRLLAGAFDDLDRLVPEYVTLPRGVRAPAAEDAVAITGHRDDGA